MSWRTDLPPPRHRRTKHHRGIGSKRNGWRCDKCGRVTKERWYRQFTCDEFWCAVCQADSISELYDKRSLQFAEVIAAILPDHRDTCYMWDEIVPLALARIRSTWNDK